MPNISAAQIEALREQRCLANAIYHEARGESVKGQKAVADVVANRAVKSGKSVCETVAEPRQFAFYGNSPMLPLDEERRKLLTNVASERTILSSDFHYFYSGSKPIWAKLMKCTHIDSQHYCKVNK